MSRGGGYKWKLSSHRPPSLAARHGDCQSRPPPQTAPGAFTAQRDFKRAHEPIAEMSTSSRRGSTNPYLRSYDMVQERVASRGLASKTAGQLSQGFEYCPRKTRSMTFADVGFEDPIHILE